MTGERSEKFQEAFERFEKVVDIDRIPDYKTLVYAFEKWAAKGYRLTDNQLSALEFEVSTRGIFAWRCESITVRGKTHVIYRDTKTGRFIKNPNAG